MSESDIIYVSWASWSEYCWSAIRKVRGNVVFDRLSGMLPCHRLNNLRLWKFEHEIIQWDITYCLKPEFPHLSKQLFPISLSFNQSIDLQQHYIQTKIRLFFFFCWLRRTNDEFIVCRHARPQNHNRNTTKTKSDTHKLLNVGCVQMSCGRSGTITVCICIERKEKKNAWEP